MKLKTFFFNITVVVFMLSFANFAKAEEKAFKIAVIGSEADLAKELDLLTVEFSKVK